MKSQIVDVGVSDGLAGDGEAESDVSLEMLAHSQVVDGSSSGPGFYHVNCHDGGIGDEKCPVQVSAIHFFEEDMKLSHVKSLEFV